MSFDGMSGDRKIRNLNKQKVLDIFFSKPPPKKDLNLNFEICENSIVQMFSKMQHVLKQIESKHVKEENQGNKKKQKN